MRKIALLTILLIGLLITSCGGGGGGSSSYDAKISVRLGFDNSRVTDRGFFVSNTEIGSVKLDYYNSKGAGSSIDVTSAAQSGEVELTELTIDTTYTFTLKAFAPGGSEVCSGEANVFINPDVVNQVNLTCKFEESLALANSVYNFLTLLTNDFSSLTAEDVDEYIASDFGTFNGMDREAFIEDLLKENHFYIGEEVKLLKIELVTPTARESKVETFMRTYYSDGSIITELINMVQEDGKWVLTGNGRKYEVALSAAAINYLYADGTKEMYTGILTEHYDCGETASSAVIKGEGLSEDFILQSDESEGCNDLLITSPTQSIPNYLRNNGLIVLEELMTGTEEPYTDLVYSTETSYKDSSSDTYTDTVYGTPVALGNLTENHFPSIETAVSPASFISGPVTLSFIKPTAYTVENMMLVLELFDYSGNHIYVSSYISMDSLSISKDVSGELDFVPTEGYIRVAARDEDGKEFITVKELDVSSTVGIRTAEVDGYAFLSDGVYSNGAYTLCGYAEENSVKTPTVFTGSNSNFSGSQLSVTSGDPYEMCQEAEHVSNPISSIYDHVYLAGKTSNGDLILSLFDESGSKVWSKTYINSKSSSYKLIDMQIINNDHALLLFSAVSKIFLVEIDTDGSIIAKKELEMTALYASYEMKPYRMYVSPSNDILIVGQFYDGVVNYVNTAMFITVSGDYSAVVMGGNALTNSDKTSKVDSVFTSAQVINADEIIFAGAAEPASGDEGDVFISRYSISETKFYNYSFDNLTVGQESASDCNLTFDALNSKLYLSVNFKYVNSHILKFTFPSDSPVVDWKVSLYDSEKTIFIKDIFYTPEQSIAIYGDTEAGNEKSKILFGLMDEDGSVGDEALPDNFDYSEKVKATEPVTLVSISIFDSNSFILVEDIADNGLSAMLQNTILGSLLPLDGESYE